MTEGKKKPAPKWSTEQVRDISVAIYKMRLEQPSGGGKGAVARMLEEDNDGGQKLRNRAGAYDALTRCYLEVLENREMTNAA